jgi:hypothetical protein
MSGPAESTDAEPSRPVPSRQDPPINRWDARAWAQYRADWQDAMHQLAADAGNEREWL